MTGRLVGLGALALALALAACDPVWRLDVTVRSPASVPLEGAALILTGCPRQNEHDLGTVAALTDADGEASVGGTGLEYPPGCVVTVARPGYRTEQLALDDLCGEGADCDRSRHLELELAPE